MGRPKAYSRAEALDKMTRVFWRKGYTATTLSDIEEATGVGRKSLVNDFGTKETMFGESLSHYLDIKAKPDGVPLMKEPLSLDNVRAFFRGIRYRDEQRWGCLMALTILEQDSVPPSAAEIAKGLYLQLEQAFLANLLPAVKDGRIPSRKEATKLATFLLNTLHGIIVNERAGRSNADLKRVVDVALSVLPG